MTSVDGPVYVLGDPREDVGHFLFDLSQWFLPYSPVGTSQPLWESFNRFLALENDSNKLHRNPTAISSLS